MIASFVVILLGIGLIHNVIVNFDKVCAGVSVSGVDVSGLSREEAATRIEDTLGERIREPVVLNADDATTPESTADAQQITTSATDFAANTATAETDSRSWSLSPKAIGAAVDGKALAEEAFAVGRGLDFFNGRLLTPLFGTTIEASISYDAEEFDALIGLLTSSIGWPMQNAGITLEEGELRISPAQDGYTVKNQDFEALLSKALLSDERSLTVPMHHEPPAIEESEAASLLASVETAISQPVTITYDGDEALTWEIEPSMLETWVGTEIDASDPDDPRLTAIIDPSRMKADLDMITAGLDPGFAPQDAQFAIVDDAVTIIPGVDGEGVDAEKTARHLSDVLFSGKEAPREVPLSLGPVPPAVAAQDLEALGITEMITTFTTSYPPDAANRVSNIHLVSDILNNSLIAPGAEWSYNGTTGNCTADRGFLPANAINGAVFVEEVGGGICQVASTVYNVILDAGFPVLDRTFHSRYSDFYPFGRDATVSWPNPDLKFQNDSPYWLLLTVTYTDSTVTATFWGTDPGYEVSFVMSEPYVNKPYTTEEVLTPDLPAGTRQVKIPGMNGESVTVTRTVYDSDGNLLREGTYLSVYSPQTEVIEVGTG